MTSGGCVVFSRSHANIDSVTDAIHRLTRAQQAAGLTVSAHFVILDEARLPVVLLVCTLDAPTSDSVAPPVLTFL